MTSSTYSEKEKISYNAVSIAHLSNYGKISKLFDSCGSWQKAWQKSKHTVENTEINPQLEWEKIKKRDIRLVLREDKEFPERLKEIPLAPHAIYVKGGELNLDFAISIVGTRKATLSGKNLAGKIAEYLSLRNITVVSGLALGIDTEAHKGVLNQNKKTVSVLANGLERIYPSENTNLARKIIDAGGAIISEYPLNSPTLPHKFI